MLPLIIGHRGASSVAPENTIAAFKKAIELGSDGLEFDVRLARDGVPVVIHDPTLKRTGRTNAVVGQLTSNELSEVDVGSWFGSGESGNEQDYSGERVPTLAAALDSLRGSNGPLFIELKCDDREVTTLTAAVCDVVKHSDLAPSVIIKSFQLSVIPQVRMLAPDLRTAALFAPKIMAMLRKEKHLVNIASELGADELSIHYSLATRKLMEKAGKFGLPVTIWTADNPRWVKRAIRLGLRSIITNDPARLLARRSQILAGSDQ